MRLQRCSYRMLCNMVYTAAFMHKYQTNSVHATVFCILKHCDIVNRLSPDNECLFIAIGCWRSHGWL